MLIEDVAVLERMADACPMCGCGGVVPLVAVQVCPDARQGEYVCPRCVAVWVCSWWW